MSDAEITVPATEKPSFLNRDAGMGFGIGTLVAGVFGGIVGAVIGGVVGEQRMEKEERVGRKVNPPTMWNKTLWLGAGIGSLVGGVASAALIMGALSSGPLVASVALLASAVVGIGAPVLGAYKGAQIGMTRMAADYAHAQEQVAKGTAVQAPAISKGGYQVSPEEAQLLESRMRTGGKQNFADTIEQQVERPRAL